EGVALVVGEVDRDAGGEVGAQGGGVAAAGEAEDLRGQVDDAGVVGGVAGGRFRVAHGFKPRSPMGVSGGLPALCPPAVQRSPAEEGSRLLSPAVGAGR